MNDYIVVMQYRYKDEADYHDVYAVATVEKAMGMLAALDDACMDDDRRIVVRKKVPGEPILKVLPGIDYVRRT